MDGATFGPRIRKSGLPPRAVLVVRGDLLDVTVLAADAERMRRRYPEWHLTGVSAFLAADDAEVDALCETKLANFEVVLVFERAQLTAAVVQIVPTFRTPHVTLAAPSAAALVSSMIRVPHRALPNPYHE